jgi:UrcA family protein
MFAMVLTSMCAVSAPVQLHDDVPWRRVNFADLDLTKTAGAAVLYARIKSAAREVCISTDWLPKMSTVTDECRAQAVARAVADVNAPALTAYYQHR